MGVRSGLMCMSNIVLICIGLIMIGTGLYQKRSVSQCLPNTGSAFVVIGLILVVIPQLGLYAPCCRSKLLFSAYFYGMFVVILVVGGFSFQCFLYTSTIRIANDPSADLRPVDQFLGRLVPHKAYFKTKQCIVNTTDCNINGSENSKVWRYCCVQPDGCEDKQMFGKPGEWNWKTQYQKPNPIPKECAYEYCLDCKGCELSILGAIVHQWRYLSVFSDSALLLCLVAFAMAWSLRRSFGDSDDFRGFYG